MVKSIYYLFIQFRLIIPQLKLKLRINYLIIIYLFIQKFDLINYLMRIYDEVR